MKSTISDIRHETQVVGEIRNGDIVLTAKMGDRDFSLFLSPAEAHDLAKALDKMVKSLCPDPEPAAPVST